MKLIEIFSLYFKVGTSHENMNIQSISVFLHLADKKFLHSILEILLPKLENSAKTMRFF